MQRNHKLGMMQECIIDGLQRWPDTQMIKDRDIRFQLKQDLLNDHADDPHVRIVDELVVCYGETRVDIALINSELAGFEIKSAADTLARLPLQVACYSKAFERMTIVASENHLQEIKQMIPGWWGIMLAKQQKGKLSLARVRTAKRNPNLDSQSLLQFLWRCELLRLIELEQLPKSLSKKNKLELFAELGEQLPLDRVLKFVRETLKNRTDWRVGTQQNTCAVMS